MKPSRSLGSYLSALCAVAVLAACDDPMSPAPLAQADAAAHAAVVGLTVTTAADFANHVSWPDNATNESGWEVHRSTTGTSGTFTLLASLSANRTTHSDAGLSPATEYCYKVRSFRISGKNRTFAAFSSAACVTTFPRPAAPTGLRGTPRDYGNIELIWETNSTGQTDVHRASSPQGTWERAGSLPSSAKTFLDTRALIENLSCYRLTTWNEWNVQSEPSSVVCTGQPHWPLNLSATSGASSVTLAWTDDSNIEDGYEVLRSSAGSESVAALLPANATSFEDAAITPDVVYTYRIRATRDGGFSQFSPSATGGIATKPPEPPQGVSATPGGSTIIAVSWTRTPLATSYRVERSPDGSAPWVEVGVAPDTASSMSDVVASEDTVHYRVVAINAYGESAPSQTDFTAAPNAPTPTVADSYGVGWIDNSNVEDGYQVWTCTIVDCFETWTTGPNATWGWSGGLAARGYLIAAIRDGGYSDLVWISLADFSVSSATRTFLMQRAKARKGLKP